ncbi:hypothetical protein NPX13_g7521 [Xylaria arbuscula]|uniref:Uncharacterized protein n=1 Tax=Xylaria arbuscula TaxID=114810 RepID=A0A9W8NAF2_9PEZI|nr:hypothetical protein NPX13_g7521 [Xylaria arbuscula]
MAAFIEAIGLISGLLGIVQFGLDNFSSDDSEGSTIRISVGLDFDGGLSNSGGDLPDVRLFNEVGGFLGIKADPGSVDKGKFSDITVKHKDDAGSQATYTLFSANDDAICVAAATISWPNGDKYAWVGDWGRQCGGTWYYSNTYVGATNYKPDCLWIDANGDQPQTGFQVHWPEFANKGDSAIPDTPEDQTARIEYICNSGPPFKLRVQPDTDPRDITYWTPHTPRSDGLVERDVTGVSYGPSKHAASAKFRRYHYPRSANGTTTVHDMVRESLVMSDSKIHTATDLCGSETSYGPDFINLSTGMFCSMSDKTLWPICSNGDGADTTQKDCFDVASQQLIVGGLKARDEPYKKVIDWTSSQ